MPNVWMVHAGKGGYIFEDFEQKNCVAIGWLKLKDLSGLGSKEELRSVMDEAYSDDSPGKRGMSFGQVARFRFDMKPGDPVLSYDSDARVYLVGDIAGPYQYEPELIEDYPHVRPVQWRGRVNRDALSVPSKNALGAIMTLFSLNEDAWKEVDSLLKGEKPREETAQEDEELERIREEVLGRSHEFIKDRVQKLSWDQMQDLVAGILRAMGYKTHVSDRGSDRGKDIVASPDGLGFEQPRIRVEVKHRPKQQMGAPDIRSFIGALRQNDKGLYVSTGGFSREAHYEAERAPVPVTLVDLDALVSLLVQHYDNLDTDTRALVPLMRVYWPAP